MNLEKQVCSLELAKRLKELKFKQESLFYHVRLTDTPDAREHWLLRDRKWGVGALEEYSAFTVAELGQLLPDELCDEDEDLPYFLTSEKRSDPDYWVLYYKQNDRGLLGGLNGPLHIEAATEADARAEMLIYLIEHKLIDPSTLQASA